MNIIYIVNTLFSFYFVLIILRVFLTWIPSLDWNTQPLSGLKAITDCYLNLFRKFIPPIGGFDFSPIIALMLLSVIQAIVIYILSVMGLS